MTDQTTPTANDHARTVASRLNALADFHENRGTGLPPQELRALAVSLGPTTYAADPDPTSTPTLVDLDALREQIEDLPGQMVAAWLAGQKPEEERLKSISVVRRDDLLALLDTLKDGAQS